MSIQPVAVSTKEVSFSNHKSNLKIDYVSGVGAVTVYSIKDFAINQVVLIGEYGAEGSEMINTHGSTAPTGFTVTFASNTVKPHQKDTPVYILSFNQIEFSHADTLTGAKTVLSLQDINPEDDEMVYEDNVNTAGYYFTRYYNSITFSYSDYSDGIPYSGLPSNTVGYAIDTAMNELDAKFSEKLTFATLIGFSKQMLNLIRGKQTNWQKYKEFDYNFGTVSQGVRKIALPSTAYDQNSNKSILNLRIGSGLSLTPIDNNEYVEETEGVVYTEVATLAVVGGTSLVLDDTSDLDDDGTIDVFVSGTKYTVEYTANNKTTNTLTVDTDQITYAFPVDSPVWQNIEEDAPEFFSVKDGYIYFWPMIDSSYEGNNMIGDFLTDIETIDSQMDVLLGNKCDGLIQFLKWKIRAVNENNGKEDMKDPSYLQFREIMGDDIRNNPLPEGAAFRPRGKAIGGGRSHLTRR